MAGILRTDTIQNSNTSTIITQTNSTTITIGTTGQTVALASGASSSGFGRSGVVNWDTTAKTTGFTAVNGVGYFCNTTSGAFTMTLPATPSVGDLVALKDYANTFDTNNLTIGRNGSKINGVSANAIISVQGQALTLIYIDATQGWSAIYGATDSDLPAPQFITATGGTILTCGDYKSHVFTGPGTFTVSCAGNVAGSNSVEYMVVAGGGGASFGGGGAGGFRQNYPSPTSAGLPVAATAYPITVGSGGAFRTSGSNSIFSTITSAGGGNGGGPSSNAASGASGGSGGGGGHNTPGGGLGYPGGSGNTPPVSPSQGFSGGSGYQSTCYYGGGGGGGATAIGTNGSNTSGVFCRTGGNGGDGNYLPITVFGPTAPSYGTPGPVPAVRYFAGGGGGAYKNNGPTYGNGGAGGGGTASSCGSTVTPATTGTINTGGGGGGANSAGQAGGSGIVIIRYKFQ